MSQLQQSPRYPMDSATHPGWVILTPDHRPYAWYTYDQALSYDQESVMVRFESDTACRHDILAAGWSVQAGAATELISYGRVFARGIA